MSYFNLETLLKFVLPKLLTMTLVSFAIGSVVGAVVGWLATLIWRRTQRGKDLSRSGRWLIKPAIFGSFVGMLLIGMLPIEANPASRIGGPYGGLWFLLMFLILGPLGSISGAILGAILGANLPARIKLPKLMGIVLLVTYLLCASILYVGLAPPAVVISTPPNSGPFPVVAELTGYDSSPKDLALSDNGQQLAIATVRYSEDQVEIWDLPSRRVVHTLQNGPSGSATLRDILASLGFSQDGRELITAAVQQVQVQNLANGEVRLRLDGGEVAYPMADNKLVTLAAVDAWADKPEPYNLKVWDLTSGQLLHTIPANLAPSERVNLPIAVSPDRRLLAFPPTLYNDQIQVWDIPNHKQVSSLVSKNPAGVLSLAFSPDGQQLAIALGQGPPLSIWNWRSEALVKTITNAGRAEQLYWTKQGIFIGSAGEFKVWNPQTGEVLHTLDLQPPSDSSPDSIKLPLGPSALSADCSVLTAYVPRQGIRVWQVGEPAKL
ncbi:WD40 repeat domain-containing protein [Synechococcales cyanobacterium C]|uniref:WD40 repeat domain-containing protein n=1 Tax=Petrachloros mirabilis ULC683 TaxID=2781853 RepID=A0A8K2A8Y1_9CYAN|nr:WD40 repeat domain-containing protein [Petrachloros mirabilis ULC683]